MRDELPTRICNFQNIIRLRVLTFFFVVTLSFVFYTSCSWYGVQRVLNPIACFTVKTFFSPFSVQRARRFPNSTQTQAVKIWSRDVLHKEVRSYKEVILPYCFVKFNLKPNSEVNIPKAPKLFSFFSGV